MDGSVLKKEWLANREPKPPGELPGKVLAFAGPIKQTLKCRL